MSNGETVITMGLGEERAVVRRVLGDVPFPLSIIDGVGAETCRESADVPLCFVVRADSPSAADDCVAVRETTLGSGVPLIAVVPRPHREEVRAAFRLGVDDYVPMDDLFALVPKIHALRQRGPGPSPDRACCVVLADPRRQRRVQLAGQLRRMAMDVRFASNHLEVRPSSDVRLVVAALDLPSVGALECMRSFRRRTAGAHPPWIIVGAPGDHARVRASIIGEPRVAWYATRDDPAQIVSVANRLLRPDVRSLRRSARLPFLAPALVEFRTAARSLWTSTYNISLGGAFLRTLTPPPVGDHVRVSFAASEGTETITMDARVVWRVGYEGANGHPAGFGVQFDETKPERSRPSLVRVYGELSRSQLSPLEADAAVVVGAEAKSS